MREAGDHTQWTAPDEAYEAAVHAAVDAAFDHAEVRRVLDGLLEQVVDAGWSNALAAKLLALTMPGVPDVYQGSELWEQSLVDPDNRRPVDFDHRAAPARLQPPSGPVPAAGSTTPARPSCWSPRRAAAAPRPARAVHVVRRRAGRGRRGRRTSSPSTAAGRSPWPPGCRSASPPRGGWGDTTLALPERHVARPR